MHTQWFRFLGMNIKGTPAMPAEAVKHDLRVAKDEADILVVQEYRWPWYWRVMRNTLGSRKRWRSAPGARRGILNAVFAAQAVLWKSKLFKRCDTKVRILHHGAAGISEDRRLRAVRLQDKESGFSWWNGTTHFVVGGDEAGDSPRRKQIMRQDLAALDRFLGDLKETGFPIIFQLDANIHPGSWAYVEFMAIMKEHDATLHGQHGVEFLFTINGPRGKVEVKRDFVVPTTKLRTDHEGRGIVLRVTSV